ncbi:hypothetical protein BC834DRAFT_193081 [Gloeopeniophorella convolvens]|nr:hypothetical protein BC834DRAFT_193081 [Gloeopeniophorella convolvens]
MSSRALQANHLRTLRPSTSQPLLVGNLLWITKAYSSDHRASAQLFADAEREESEQSHPSPRGSILPGTEKHANWTGDESMEDAVLRMLMDKYKPLRTGTIQTAEEKLRRSTPQISLPPGLASEAQDASPHPPTYRVGEPLLPAVEGHKPWLTTFKAPSHATSSVRYGRFPASATGPSRSTPADPDDERMRKKDRDAKKRSQIAGRITQAKESTLDYRLGIKTPHGSTPVHVPRNPVSMKGWAGLIEERIERARLEGHFRSIKGRGKPLQRASDENNPFIAREEFLMNRIVQRQGAAPPWVDAQGELEAAISTFRAVLKQSWIRRAVRMLTLSLRPIEDFTLADARALIDAEWEAREEAYHESALAEINSLVRKYNTLAPYAVRRPYYVRSVELRKAYEESGEEILQELAGQLRTASASRQRSGSPHEEEDCDGGRLRDEEAPGAVLGLRDLLRRWLRWR